MSFYQHRPFWLVIMTALAIAIIIVGVKYG